MRLPRKAFEPGGFAYILNGGHAPLPPNVAYREIADGPRSLCRTPEEDGFVHESFTHVRADGYEMKVSRWVRFVTWDEVMAERRREQRQRLDRLASDCVESRVLRLTVRYERSSRQWFAYLVAAGNATRAFAEERHDRHVADLMRRWPLPQHDAPLFAATTGRQWLAAFARKYRHGTHNGRPQGVLLCRALCRHDQIIQFL